MSHFDSLITYIDELNYCFDVKSITELWPNTNNETLFSIPNYNKFSFPRLTSHGGSICIYFKQKKNLCKAGADLTPKFSSFEHAYQVTFCKSGCETYILLVIYRPPYNSILEFIDKYTR